jgi:hypothetical protein
MQLWFSYHRLDWLGQRFRFGWQLQRRLFFKSNRRIWDERCFGFGNDSSTQRLGKLDKLRPRARQERVFAFQSLDVRALSRHIEVQFIPCGRLLLRWISKLEGHLVRCLVGDACIQLQILVLEQVHLKDIGHARDELVAVNYDACFVVFEHVDLCRLQPYRFTR